MWGRYIGLGRSSLKQTAFIPKDMLSLLVESFYSHYTTNLYLSFSEEKGVEEGQDSKVLLPPENLINAFKTDFHLS